MTNKQILQRLESIGGSLNDACWNDEHINHDKHIGKAIDKIMHLIAVLRKEERGS